MHMIRSLDVHCDADPMLVLLLQSLDGARLRGLERMVLRATKDRVVIAPLLSVLPSMPILQKLHAHPCVPDGIDAALGHLAQLIRVPDVLVTTRAQFDHQDGVQITGDGGGQLCSGQRSIRAGHRHTHALHVALPTSTTCCARSAARRC